MTGGTRSCASDLPVSAAQERDPPVASVHGEHSLEKREKEVIISDIHNPRKTQSMKKGRHMEFFNNCLICNMLRVFILLFACLWDGCQASKKPVSRTENVDRPVVDREAYRFPPNVAAQMRKAVKCKEPMLLVPIVLPEWPRDNDGKAVLETPVEIAFPFDNLPSLTGYQYVVQGGLWTVGPKGLLQAFLLIGADGTVYFMDTPDGPVGGDNDIDFYIAHMSAVWQEEFGRCLNNAVWSRGTGFWTLPDGGATYRWRNSGSAVPVLREFCSDWPAVTDSKTAQWEKVRQPCFTPNVYCEKGTHAMPKFRADEILLLRPTVVVKYIRAADFTHKETQLLFPDGQKVGDIAAMRRGMDKLWKTAQYKIVAYDRRSEKDLSDPERNNPWGPQLRAYAADKGIPLVILYGDDESAPEFEGLPKGVRQYWQCPQCAREK